MNTIVASKPTERVETDPAVQEQRLPQLLDTVDAGALCTSKAPGMPSADDWFRGDGEPITEWRPRREQLLAVCGACPVRAACEESALRQREGSIRGDEDMVRGGRTSPELYQARRDQAKRLAAVRTEDVRVAQEEKEMRRIAAELRRLALVHRDSRSDSRVSDEIRVKAEQLRVARSARRARTGWNSAGAAA